MKTLSKSIALAAGTGLCMAFCAMPALAQIHAVPIGTITATIGEDAYAGETLEVPSEGSATADYQALGPVVSLSIQGHDPRAESRMTHVLALEMSLMGSDASASIMQASVSYWPGGMDAPFYSTGDGSAPQITLDALSLEDGGAAIAGQFSGSACFKADFFTPADPDQCMPIEGRFETALARLP